LTRYTDAACLDAFMSEKCLEIFKVSCTENFFYCTHAWEGLSEIQPAL